MAHTISCVAMLGRMAVLTCLGAVWAASQTYQVVDVQRVPAEGDPSVAIRTVLNGPPSRTIACDFLIAGAGAGGFAASMQAAQRGHTVCLTEETDWIGGQLTAGGVSALDEHRFIEITGGTRSYYELRERIRSYYRQHYQLSPAASRLENLNPGSCYVSALCFEPKAALAALDAMRQPYPGINLLLRTRIISLDVKEGRITSALAFRFDTNELIRLQPRFVLDATETGELLPLAHVPYVVGSEAQADTHEPHAAASANAACVQSFTYPFAIEPRPGEQHRVPKPVGYERIRDSQPFSLRIVYPEDLGWKGAVQYTMFGDLPPVPNNMSPGPFFAWRRLLDSRNFTGTNAPRDLALINWPKQDYHTESLLDRTPADTVRILQEAKRVSLAFLYWLQNDLPRDDGQGRGYPELMLRPDVMGSSDGLSKYPYIRESRRLRAAGRVVEQDIVVEDASVVRAKPFADSIGTGFYMVDIHPCGANERGRMMMPKPFQVPMATLVPSGVSNLLAAGKNLGVTHLTNGAFRLHPIEWNIGESAAIMGSFALRSGHLPRAADIQPELIKAGISLVWFDDLPVSHPSFAAIQLTALRGVYPLNNADLHSSPDAPVTRAEAAAALAAYFQRHTTREQDMQLAVKEGWMAVDHRNWFHPDLPFYWTDWREDKMPARLPAYPIKRTGPVKRAELAERLAMQ